MKRVMLRWLRRSSSPAAAAAAVWNGSFYYPWGCTANRCSACDGGCSSCGGGGGGSSSCGGGCSNCANGCGGCGAVGSGWNGWGAWGGFNNGYGQGPAFGNGPGTWAVVAAAVAAAQAARRLVIRAIRPTRWPSIPSGRATWDRPTTKNLPRVRQPDRWLTRTTRLAARETSSPRSASIGP